MGKFCLLLFVLIWATIARASEAPNCVKLLSTLSQSSKDTILDISNKENLDLKQTAKLAELVIADPDLAELLSQPVFVEYIKGVAQNKSLDELRSLLFKLWKDNHGSDLNLNKVLTSDLKNIFANSQSNYNANSSYKYNRFLVQIKSFLKTLTALKAQVKQELHPSVLDSRMWDFYGYLNLKLDISRLRPWPKVDGSFGAIKLSDVTGINPNTFVKTAMLASEIEEPINAYSDNSGEVIRVISPQASRFMGKTAEEALALKNKQESLKKEGKRPPSYCTNSWCFEENRHEGTLATISQNIVGRPLPMNAPFSAYPNLNPLRVNDAFFHLIARNDTEWHAASAYFFLGAHSKNALNQWVANVRHDELKHMSIFGGLYKYLRGNTYNSRLKGMLLKMLEEIKEKDSKSDYADFASEPLSLLELAYVHIMYEKEIRLFFKSLPLKSLRKIYETKVNLEPLESTPIEASKLLQLKQAIEQETKMRKTLARWPKSQRKHYEELEDFEKQFDALIIKIISDLEYFKGAEDFENPKHIELISTINYMTESQIAAVYGVSIGAKQLALLKQSLQETIRDYQIMNNQTVRSLGLSVKFVDAHTGFDIVRDETYNSLKKAN